MTAQPEWLNGHSWSIRSNAVSLEKGRTHREIRLARETRSEALSDNHVSRTRRDAPHLERMRVGARLRETRGYRRRGFPYGAGLARGPFALRRIYLRFHCCEVAQEFAVASREESPKRYASTA